jgi:hypothetical protein
MYVTVARVLIYRKLRVACVPASWASLLRSVWYAVGVWRYASGERLISVQSGSYQCKRICKRIRDMDTNMAVDMGDKSVYIRAFWPRKISQSTSLSSIQSNIACYRCTWCYRSDTPSCYRGRCLLYTSSLSPFLFSLYHRIHAHGSPQLPYRNIACYYMIWRDVADTEIAELTHKLRTHSRRLIHEFSLAAATGICNHELPWTSMVFQALMYIKTELLLR